MGSNMKKSVCNVAYALIVLIYYSFFILDSALSDTTGHQIKPTDATLQNETLSDSLSTNNATLFNVDNNIEASEATRENVKENVVFSEVTSHNTDPIGIINDTPVILSLSDSATKELENLATESFNDGFNDSQQLKNLVTNATETYNKSIPEANVEKETQKLSLNVSANTTTEQSEEIPSFSEWAQKQLEEVEKKEPLNSSISGYNLNGTRVGSNAKLRWKNYASVDCGAKVIQANPEAQNSWAILSPSRDEYKLNPCNSRVWFVVELCEAIQVKKIDLANYELFSSSPKDFVVSVSDRFPTRDWWLVGHFAARDERDVQSFDLNHENFGKYIKIEIKSHYGAEHYCPLSLFRAYGTSVFEVLQKEDPAHAHPPEDDDDDGDEIVVGAETSGNLLSSATDAVISMVKKAAQVLGNKKNSSGDTSGNDSVRTLPTPVCTSPSHYVVCKNCSGTLFRKVYELLSCRIAQVKNLLKIPFVIRALVNSGICKPFGFDFRNKSSASTARSCPECVESFFPDRYLGAMCNVLAVAYGKVLRNVSYQYANGSSGLEDEKLVDIGRAGEKNLTANIEPTKPLEIERMDVRTRPSAITESTNVSEIKPSRSLRSDNFNSESGPSESVPTATTGEKEAVESDVGASVDPLPETEILKENVIEIAADDNLDKLITEINAAEISSSVVVNTASSSSQSQKESVFLRLANRIKALERNMSLSSQYLEELSKRYKKQVEEIQKLLEKTVRSVEELDARHEAKRRRLEERVERLEDVAERALAEKNDWRAMCYCAGACCVAFAVYIFWGRGVALKLPESSKPRRKRDPSKVVVSPKVKKRRRGSQFRPALDGVEENGGFAPKRTSTKIWKQPVEERPHIEDIPLPLGEVVRNISEPITSKYHAQTIKAPVVEKLKPGGMANNGPSITPPNGNAINGEGHTPKSGKRGIKKLFKKVF
ncbi:SUN domain-containing ossification factor [Cylas formicarius]|uniref:SUN domain-containing ossification factor n=1 Tax=Cylas formicarius TaxID=197179 RepID=UPI002958CC32|nr:SUN domain-containing ossification factor [Cylas formicarius]